MIEEKSFSSPNDLLDGAHSAAWVVALETVRAVYDLRGVTDTARPEDYHRAALCESANALYDAALEFELSYPQAGDNHLQTIKKAARLLRKHPSFMEKMLGFPVLRKEPEEEN